MRYRVRYVHKIRPDLLADIGPAVELNSEDFSHRTKLAAALRAQKVLQPGDRIYSFRNETSPEKVIVFPSSPKNQITSWHSIILEPTSNFGHAFKPVSITAYYPADCMLSEIINFLKEKIPQKLGLQTGKWTCQSIDTTDAGRYMVTLTMWLDTDNLSISPEDDVVQHLVGNKGMEAYVYLDTPDKSSSDQDLAPYEMTVSYPTTTTLVKAIKIFQKLVDFKTGQWRVLGDIILSSPVERTASVEIYLEEAAMRNRGELYLSEKGIVAVISMK